MSEITAVLFIGWMLSLMSERTSSTFWFFLLLMTAIVGAFQ